MATSSTSRNQRIGIWIIAALMAIGTVGSLVVVMLANDNAGKDEARLQQMLNDYNTEVEKHNNKLSEKYFPIFSPYRERVAAFEGEIKELAKEDLKQGEGEEITEDSSFWTYYIGWLPDGTVFDSSFDSSNDAIMEATKLKGPFEVEPGGVIQGWTDGMVGMKIGGVRELTIPADLAYGEAAQGDIPANSPLRFVVMVIDNKDQPEIPADLMKLYERIGAY